ncbi:MAG: glycosyltransferase family 1 protein [Ruminococcaceae bacterium]|nr:glycosyltransferase family 1 protein [Oscillospiraceae bacterium]
MKILVGYVTRLHSSGVDNYLLNVLRVAKEQGVELDFLTSCYDEDTAAELKREGCALYPVRNLKSPRGHYEDVRQVLRQGHYDKAYFNISEPLNMMGAKAAHDEGVPCILHAHSSGMDIANRYKRWIRGAINGLCRPFLSRWGDLFLACSRNAGRWLYTRRVCRSDRFQVVYNAVDTAALRPDEAAREAVRRELGIDAATLVVGHIGSYGYAKNNFFLVDIARELAKVDPAAVMLCVGDGDDRPAVMQAAQAAGVESTMRFLGVRRDVPALLNAMDVFVLPSRFEGAPIVAVEAQAAGVPCLISDRVTDEVVIADTTRQLPITDPGLWAQEIPVMAARRAQAGIRPDCLDRYSLDRQKRSLAAILFA